MRFYTFPVLGKLDFWETKGIKRMGAAVEITITKLRNLMLHFSAQTEPLSLVPCKRSFLRMDGFQYRLLAP